MKTKIDLIDSVNGNQLGTGPAAQSFFELRGFRNRKPGQTNVGDCLIWSALVNAVKESGDAGLIAMVEAITNASLMDNHLDRAARLAP